MQPWALDRRRFLATCSALGLGGTLLPGVLWSAAVSAPEARATPVTAEMIAAAAAIAGLDIAPEARAAMLKALNDAVGDYRAIHDLHLANDVPPALVFDPAGVAPPAVVARSGPVPRARPARHGFPVAGTSGAPHGDDLAFASVRHLGELLRARKVTSVELTERALERLRRLGPRLECVITLMADRALAQARAADAEIAAGPWRGPLHGVPWGVKDLLSVKGHPTTWGAGGFETQVIDADATVVQRLDAAGAVLVAKLTLGALAMGDRWFGGMTRNPWRPAQGSSGSSAGSAAAVAAGCVPFAIGSETLGSIVSPSTRCGVTGLRPTFGRVARTGAMALSWSMDKLGPMARTADDCGLVLEAIAGADGQDPAARDAPFAWDAVPDWRALRVGYLRSAFEEEPEPTPPADGSTPPADADRARRRRDRAMERATLDRLRGMGLELTDVELPQLPWSPMIQVLLAEAAAAFDELTRSGADRRLTQQGADDWPNIFRAARFVPAVEYVNMNRARTLAVRAMASLFERVDVIVAPSFGEQLLATNLTGHPAVVVPNGFRAEDEPAPSNEDDGGGPGTPVSVTFLGSPFGEANVLALAAAYQDATGFHLARPPLPGD